MNTSSFPVWICPHCLETNPPFGEGRCQHCGIHMLSEQQQQWRLEKAQPAAKQLLAWDELPDQQKNPAEIQPFIRDLAPLEHLQEGWKDWLSPFRQQLHDWTIRSEAFRKQWRSHLLILCVLVLIPMVCAFVISDLMVLLLMMLPIVGWAWIGLFEFRKKNKP